MPLGLPWRDGPLVRRALARFVTGRYDLVWYFGARPWVLAGRPVQAPTVVDLDDLEDQKTAGRMSIPQAPPEGLSGRVRRQGSSLVAGEEIRRWQRLHRRVGREAAAVVVCSELDAARARSTGVEHLAVVPNGYRSVVAPLGRTEVGRPPTVLFAGFLRYPPNIEAARWLSADVAPALRRLVPDVETRLVGEHGPELLSLDDPPRVSLTGLVPDIAPELARADLVMVPVRYGSGTRVKILEAFAHRIPVVSTSAGAEGIGAVHGVHLLIADDADGLAEAGARLLREPVLRRALTDRAHELFTRRFQSDVIESRIADLAREVVAGAQH
jgi:glycosyltransferase involved in cell wall biosynthesis